MLDVTKLLEEINASPYEEIIIKAPHCGTVSFGELSVGAKVHGVSGTWKEKPGTLLAIIERERNPRPINAPQKGEVTAIQQELEGQFVEAGTPLMTLRHFLSKEEVVNVILQKALHLFKAPERAKYYFIPEVDKKIRASDSPSVNIHDGMELFIMSRMKREVSLNYTGPEGAIYAVYFKHNDNVDAGQPLIGVCSQEQLPLIKDVVTRIETEWQERE